MDNLIQNALKHAKRTYSDESCNVRHYRAGIVLLQTFCKDPDLPGTDLVMCSLIYCSSFRFEVKIDYIE